jgi:c-di-GMP-binding flagellar brake protein YcgR
LLSVTQGEGQRGQGAQLEIGRTLDISEHGLRVETADALELGVDLELQIAAGERLIEARGRVVHCRPEADHHETGIQLTEIEDGDREALLEAVALRRPHGSVSDSGATEL